MSTSELLKRHTKNPIITTKDILFKCNSVFNAAAVKDGNNYKLLLRIELPNGYSCITQANSRNGVKFKIDKKPFISSSNKTKESFRTFESFGVEDPRITFIDGWFYIFYTGYSKYDPLTILARTRDWKRVERVSLASEPFNRNMVLFPEKIGGKYVRFDRPHTERRSDIWFSSSPDLIHWKAHKPVMEPIEGSWQSLKVGACAPPIKTKKGWLLIYHGAKQTVAGQIYRLGCALFNLKNPSKLIGRNPDPILSPIEDYERTGDVPNVVFSCGAIQENDGTLKVYYGASDTGLCLATGKITDLVKSCKK